LISLSSRTGYQAQVVLPYGCKIIGPFEGEKTRADDETAKKQAAYKACSELNKIGELDELLGAKCIHRTVSFATVYVCGIIRLYWRFYRNIVPANDHWQVQCCDRISNTISNGICSTSYFPQGSYFEDVQRVQTISSLSSSSSSSSSSSNNNSISNQRYDPLYYNYLVDYITVRLQRM
jgi:hypothetical protein